MPHHIFVFLHVLAMTIWVGGMFFAYFCLRPAAVKVLEPPQRLPLWLGTLQLFMGYVSVAVIVVLVSGYAMFFAMGAASAPMGVHIMSGTGVVMALIYAYVHFMLLSRLRRHCRAEAWTEAAAALGSIRHMVGVNLLLGVITITAAILGV